VSEKPCAVLIISPRGALTPLKRLLDASGFATELLDALPADDAKLLEHEALIVELTAVDSAPMVAARFRAKPRFGRRVLVGVVSADTPARDRFAALAGGFDDIVDPRRGHRALTATLLKHLRRRPEFRCLIPPMRKRPAA
jgi:DNA-binding response OmpR family regulator